MTVTAEGLAAHEYDRIAKAFNTKVRNGYAANECPFLSYGCEHGWQHVNSDWSCSSRSTPTTGPSRRVSSRTRFC